MHSKKAQGPSNVTLQQANHCRLFPKALSTHTDRTKRRSEAAEQPMIYLLVFLWAVSEEDAFLHVAVQNLLYGRHVALYDVLHLRERQHKQLNETPVAQWRLFNSEAVWAQHWQNENENKGVKNNNKEQAVTLCFSLESHLLQNLSFFWINGWSEEGSG